MEVKKLDDVQLQNFDYHGFVTDNLFTFITKKIDEDFPTGKFHLLDIGGGNGMFVDRLLDHYPLATGTVVDNAEVLISRNTPHERKTVILASATEISKIFAPGIYDLVFFNLSLHHFVADKFSNTRKIQTDALKTARNLMRQGFKGRMCVVENNFDGVLLHNFPGWVIFRLTSSKALAPLVKKLGANTAGCGVCFLSTQAWLNTFRTAGLHTLDSYEDYPTWDITFKARLRNLLLTIRNRPRTAFWLCTDSFQ